MNVSDSRASFDVTDDRNILKRTLPLRTYNNNGTDAYTQPDRGRVRALLWGTKTGIRPVQYDIQYYSGSLVPTGVYEVVDCTDWAAGIKEITNVHWYRDDQAALGRAQGLRVTVPGTDAALVVTLATGRFTPNFDLHPVFITAENNKLHFDVGGAVLTAVVTPGVYPPSGTVTPTALVTAVTSAMLAVDGADVGCSLTLATGKIQLWKGAGTLNLRCATGADVQMGLWDVLGFDAQADRTGALFYNGDNIVPLEAFDQTIRVDAIGFKDDASGTYTGTASAAIEKAPDIAHHILRAFLGVPLSAIDLPSFVTTRATTAGAKPCSLYIGTERTVADVFEELETSGNFDLTLSGGIWSCVARDTSVPAGTPDLVDADFLSFEAGYDPEDLFGTVILTYNDSPDGGTPIPSRGYRFPGRENRPGTGEVTDATVALRHGRPNAKTFKTCLRDAVDATTNPARLQAIATQAQMKRRRFRFTTKGKALLVPVNGKIRLTRTKGLDTTGALSNILVRVISKRDDWARWVSDVEVIEVI